MKAKILNNATKLKIQRTTGLNEQDIPSQEQWSL